MIKSKNTVPASIAPHFPDYVQFPQYIAPNPLITQRDRDADQLLFTMSGDGSLGYWAYKISHSSYRCRNDHNENF